MMSDEKIEQLLMDLPCRVELALENRRLILMLMFIMQQLVDDKDKANEIEKIAMKNAEEAFAKLKSSMIEKYKEDNKQELELMDTCNSLFGEEGLFGSMFGK